MKNAWINIITRTHNRKDYFKVCRDSVVNQNYPLINHIVGSDVPCDYYSEYIMLMQDVRIPAEIPQGMYHAPWNLYLNTLATVCVDGWVMYLDDDDKFCTPNALKYINNAIKTEDDIVVWKVQITPQWIVPSYSFGKAIVGGDFSGIGFCFHTKHLPVDWGCLSYGDFRVAKQLLNKGLKPRWLDMVLTQTQNGANNGKN